MTGFEVQGHSHIMLFFMLTCANQMWMILCYRAYTRVWVSQVWRSKERGQSGGDSLGQSRMTQTLHWKQSQVPVSRRVQRRPWGWEAHGELWGARGTVVPAWASVAGGSTAALKNAMSAGWRVTRERGRGCTNSTTPFRPYGRPFLTSKQTRHFPRSRLSRWQRTTSSP